MHVPFATPPTAEKPAKLSRWLSGLLSAKFFDPCPKHPSIKKNERNYFCLDCRGPTFCQHCVPMHRGHELLQVRRYVYHDVVRVQDVEKHIDCKAIQTYIINGANVVFLNERPQPKPTKALSKSCVTCSRSLQDHYRFCSLACKITALAHANPSATGLDLRRKRAGSVTFGHESSDGEGVEAPGTPSGNSVDRVELHRIPKREHDGNHEQEVDQQFLGFKRRRGNANRSSLLDLLKAPAAQLSPTLSSPSRRKNSTPTRSPWS